MYARSWALLLPLASLVLVGCGEAEKAAPPPEPPEVAVSTPVSAYQTDAEVFTGRTQALNYVDIRAHVTGYLDRATFREGEDVKQGDMLFEIDPRPFRAALNQAQANLKQQQAQLTFNEADYKRNLALRPRGAASEEDVERSLSARDVSRASVGSAQAAVESAQLNLDYTKVLAPFSGRISRRQVDPGNLVQADNTVLATLVQIDPLYAYFDIDERTLLRIRDLFPDGKIPADAAERFKVTLGLANENPESFSHTGKIKFTDNRVDASTGTLRIWGTFENPKHDLYPNLFIRVRMEIGAPRKTLFVAESALGSDQGRKYLYVVGDDDKIVYTPVEVGQRQNGLIAVEKGLSGGERVVVNGLQRVKPKLEVKPNLGPMPRATAPATSVPVVTPTGSEGNGQGAAKTPTGR